MRIVFRTDGNALIGLGHIVRSLALAAIVRPIADCFFAVCSPSVAVRGLLREAKVSLIELPDLPTYSAEEAQYIANHLLQSTDIVVLDGYHFSFAYQQTIKSTGCELVCIDDLHATPFAADLIINHSPGVEKSSYLAPPTSHFCLGPAFSLLRTPFLQHAQRLSEVPVSVPIRQVLLCFGGADPQRFTARFLTALLTLPSIQRVGVVLGGAFGHEEVLSGIIAKQLPGRIELYRNITADEFVKLFLKYQVAVCPASTVLIESLVLGCATITGYYVDNQQRLANYVHAHKQAFSLGDLTQLSDAELPAALLQGLRFHEVNLRTPYVKELAHSQLQEEFKLLAQRN